MRPTLLYSIIWSLVAFPLTTKYVTLNDCEWLEGSFYVICYYELPLTIIICYLFTVVCLLHV